MAAYVNDPASSSLVGGVTTSWNVPLNQILDDLQNKAFNKEGVGTETVTADVAFSGETTFNNVIDGYTTIVTADGTTTLTVASTHTQRFTGTLDQNCKAPVTSTLVLGQSYKIVNDSTGIITAQASDGASEICKVQPGERALITCILLTGTDETSWTYELIQSESQTTELSQQVSIQSAPDGTVTGGVTDGLISGLTLVNSVVLGDVATNVTSDNTNTLIKVNPNGTWALDSVYNSSYQTYNITNGEKWFVYFKILSSSIGDLAERVYIQTSTQEQLLGGLVYETTESYGLFTVTISSGLANISAVEGNSGIIYRDYQTAINMTALGIESYTEAQMLDLVRGGYFEGMANSKNLAVKSVGKNLFDKQTVTKNKYVDFTDGVLKTIANFNASDYIKVKPSTTYYVGNVNANWAKYDANKNYITTLAGSVNFQFTTESNCQYVRITLSNTNLGVTQLEEGSTATTYESYRQSLFETECELRSVKNATGLTRDTVDDDGNLTQRISEFVAIATGTEVNTTNYTDAKDGGYYLVLQDDGIMLNGTVGDTVITSDAGDVIYELAETVTTNLVTEGKASGSQKAFENGITYQDCAYNQAITSSGTPDITLTEALREITQVTYINTTTNETVEVPVSGLTLSADGLTITGSTLPSTTECQVKGYLFYNIPALITGNVAVNLKAVVDSLNEIVSSQSAQITSLQDNQNLIWALL